MKGKHLSFFQRLRKRKLLRLKNSKTGSPRPVGRASPTRIGAVYVGPEVGGNNTTSVGSRKWALTRDSVPI